jgi:hypothetical protein
MTEMLSRPSPVAEHQAMREQYANMAGQEAADAALAAAKKMHDLVSCEGTQIGIFYNRATGTLEVFSRLVAKAKALARCCLIMYAISRESLGNPGCEKIVSCKSLPCHAARLEAWSEPQDSVGPPTEDDPPIIYRSGYRGSTPQCAVPTTVLPDGSCTPMHDGSKYFTLKTADHILDEAELAKAIAEGKYINDMDYNQKMRNACMEAFLKLLRNNDVPLHHLMDVDTEPDEEGNPKPDAESLIAFTDQLYPLFKKGIDILVFVPKIEEDGTVKLNGSFPVHLRYRDLRKKIPILGLVHNDVADAESSTSLVEHSFKIFSNVPFKLSCHNEETGVTKPVVLHAGREYFPSAPEVVGCLEHGQPHYRSMYYSPSVDYNAWHIGCDKFQKAIAKQIWASTYKACPSSDVNPECEDLFMCDLEGEFMPKFCTDFECELPMSEFGVDAERLRKQELRDMKARKRAAADEAVSRAAESGAPSTDVAMDDAPITPPVDSQARTILRAVLMGISNNRYLVNLAIAASCAIRPDFAPPGMYGSLRPASSQFQS